MIVYLLFAIYGVALVFVLAFVHARFRAANRLLRTLKKDWESAGSKYAEFIVQAKEKIAALEPVPAARSNSESVINDDLRSRVLEMASEGASTAHIARTSGLSEGEIHVLLGLARIQAYRVGVDALQ
jgi:hypothetical protein